MPSARLIACMRRRDVVLGAVIAAIWILGNNIKLRLGFEPGRLSMLLHHGKSVVQTPWAMVVSVPRWAVDEISSIPSA